MHHIRFREPVRHRSSGAEGAHSLTRVGSPHPLQPFLQLDRPAGTVHHQICVGGNDRQVLEQMRLVHEQVIHAQLLESHRTAPVLSSVLRELFLQFVLPGFQSSLYLLHMQRAARLSLVVSRGQRLHLVPQPLMENPPVNRQIREVGLSHQHRVPVAVRALRSEPPRVGFLSRPDFAIQRRQQPRVRERRQKLGVELADQMVRQHEHRLGRYPHPFHFHRRRGHRPRLPRPHLVRQQQIPRSQNLRHRRLLMGMQIDPPGFQPRRGVHPLPGERRRNPSPHRVVVPGRHLLRPARVVEEQPLPEPRLPRLHFLQRRRRRLLVQLLPLVVPRPHLAHYFHNRVAQTRLHDLESVPLRGAPLRGERLPMPVRAGRPDLPADARLRVRHLKLRNLDVQRVRYELRHLLHRHPPHTQPNADVLRRDRSRQHLPEALRVPHEPPVRPRRRFRRRQLRRNMTGQIQLRRFPPVRLRVQKTPGQQLGVVQPAPGGLPHKLRVHPPEAAHRRVQSVPRRNRPLRRARRRGEQRPLHEDVGLHHLPGSRPGLQRPDVMNPRVGRETAQLHPPARPVQMPEPAHVPVVNPIQLRPQPLHVPPLQTGLRSQQLPRRVPHLQHRPQLPRPAPRRIIRNAPPPLHPEEPSPDRVQRTLQRPLRRNPTTRRAVRSPHQNASRRNSRHPLAQSPLRNLPQSLPQTSPQIRPRNGPHRRLAVRVHPPAPGDDRLTQNEMRIIREPRPHRHRPHPPRPAPHPLIQNIHRPRPGPLLLSRPLQGQLPVPPLEQHHIRHHIRPRMRPESIVRQPHRPQKPSQRSQTLPLSRILRVQRKRTRNRRQQPTRLQQPQRLIQHVIMQRQISLRTVNRVIRLKRRKRHIPHRQPETALMEIPEIRRHHPRPRMQQPRQLRRQPIQLHPHQLRLHPRRRSAEEHPVPATRLQHPPAPPPQTDHRPPHRLRHHRRRVMSINRTPSRRPQLPLRQQPRQLLRLRPQPTRTALEQIRQSPPTRPPSQHPPLLLPQHRTLPAPRPHHQPHRRQIRLRPALLPRRGSKPAANRPHRLRRNRLLRNRRRRLRRRNSLNHRLPNHRLRNTSRRGQNIRLRLQTGTEQRTLI